jgi:hypothetical protein
LLRGDDVDTRQWGLNQCLAHSSEKYWQSTNCLLLQPIPNSSLVNDGTETVRGRWCASTNLWAGKKVAYLEA